MKWSHGAVPPLSLRQLPSEVPHWPVDALLGQNGPQPYVRCAGLQDKRKLSCMQERLPTKSLFKYQGSGKTPVIDAAVGDECN